MIAKLPAYMDYLGTKKDGSYKITFVTQEMNSEDGMVLLNMRNKLGWLLFSPEDNIKEEEIPKESPKEFPDDKTPSQRLRGVVFLYWKSLGSKGSFDAYYKVLMEKFINQVKVKLEL